MTVDLLAQSAIARRAPILHGFGATAAETDELLAYGANAFVVPDGEAMTFPLADEPHVETWTRYADLARREGVLATLRARLPQLAFPVDTGRSATDAYQRATRRGEWPDPATVRPLELEAPDALELFVHATLAGRIAVLVAGARADFVTLLRALTRRNEPEPIPPSMGACMIGGYTNWDRVARLRDEWTAARNASPATAREPAAARAAAWATAFRALTPQKARYQDRFILLARGPYSGVAASSVGVDDDAWPALSLRIRLEHECAHYFTRRVFGVMRNTLHDELLADYAGIVGATGAYRADWFLAFVGLESAPRYRTGGRLENYRGTPPLSDGAFAVLQHVVCAAAAHVEQFDARLPASRGAHERAAALAAIASVSIHEIAGDDGVQALDAAYDAFVAAREVVDA